MRNYDKLNAAWAASTAGRVCGSEAETLLSEADDAWSNNDFYITPAQRDGLRNVIKARGGS
jgi:hypothetical protein